MEQDIYFNDLIGQDKIKKQLSFYIDAHKKTKVIPHILFVAPRGMGKTMFARSMGKNLLNREGKPKTFIEINASTIKNIKSLVNQVLIPFVIDKEATLFFDECHSFQRDVTNALLTILNNTSNNRTSFSFEDYTLEFDFSLLSVVMATTEGNAIFPPLADRLTRIEFDDFNKNDLSHIVKENITKSGLKIEDDALLDIASILRSNARSAVKISTDIKNYLHKENTKVLTIKGWEELKNILNILPFGLSKMEKRILEILKENGETSLTSLSAKLNMTKESLQKDCELFLLRHNFMSIAQKGRIITKKGQDYLEKALCK